MTLLDHAMATLDEGVLREIRGSVREVRGLAIRVAALPAPVGAMVTILCSGQRPAAAEVVGFDQDMTIVMPFGAVAGIRRADPVILEQTHQSVAVGEGLLGRVIDALGRPIDGKGPIRAASPRLLHPPPLAPMGRPLIDTPLATGVRAIDALISVGRGQRLGIFAQPGVGKSTLLGMMARGTEADVNVIALIGERGRELADFIHHHLGEEGLPRSVVVCATGDEPPLMRIRAAHVALTVAESFRDRDQQVLLIMDSLTRFCHAQRQVGLSIGEPPATKGYTPSVFAALPLLLERCGRARRGAITGFFAVLAESADLDDPVSDAARGVLDGHILLARKFAQRNHWPAIDITGSISRVADDVTDRAHQQAAATVRRLLAAYEQVEDLLHIGAYASGSSADFDLAIACKPMIDQLVQQGRFDASGRGDFDRTRRQLLALMQGIEQQKRKGQKR